MRETMVQQQASLAGMTELLNHAFTIHSQVMDMPLPDVQSDDKSSGCNELHRINTMFVLLGDFLLASILKEIGDMRCWRVAQLMSTTISDHMQARFVDAPDSTLTPDEMEEVNFGLHGSLLGNSCRAVLVLGKQDDAMQEQGYQFGKNFALARHTFNQLHPFLPNSSLVTRDSCPPFDLMSTPVLLHLNQTGLALKDYASTSKQGKPVTDLRALHTAVSNGIGVSRTRDLLLKYCDLSLQALSAFPASDSVTVLRNMVHALRGS